jgi:large subunit ribosomal protein L13
MDTFTLRKEDVIRKWYLVDASGVPLGRLASFVVTILRGKNKPTFTPHVDCGDYVVVINAGKVRLTGHKIEQKYHFTTSGRPGGDKYQRYEVVMKERPELIVQWAVKGMIPHNKLGEKIFRKLKVYAGQEHPHGAYSPERIEVPG